MSSIRKVPRKLLKLFLQGVIILAPISLTIWTVVAVFNWIDNILPNTLHNLFPGLVTINQFGLPVRIPGIGFFVFIGIALFVAALAFRFGARYMSGSFSSSAMDSGHLSPAVALTSAITLIFAVGLITGLRFYVKQKYDETPA